MPDNDEPTLEVEVAAVVETFATSIRNLVRRTTAQAKLLELLEQKSNLQGEQIKILTGLVDSHQYVLEMASRRGRPPDA